MSARSYSYSSKVIVDSKGKHQERKYMQMSCHFQRIKAENRLIYDNKRHRQHQEIFKIKKPEYPFVFTDIFRSTINGR